MKAILNTTVLCLFIMACRSQTFPLERDYPVFPESGMYFQDTNNSFDKFEGTWEYMDSTKRLRIVLQKVERFQSGSAEYDMILGNIIYEENGVEIINTLSSPSTSQGSDDIYHIEMFVIRNPNLIVGNYEDPIRSKWTDYGLALDYSSSISIETNTMLEQLEWNVRIREFYNPDGDPDARQELRVPKTLTLTKVE